MEAKHPNKQQGHDWMLERAKRKKPIPDIETIRREMGIALIEADREALERSNLKR